MVTMSMSSSSLSFATGEVQGAFYRYPPQVILVRLDKIPAVNSKMLDQIRQLLPASKQAVVIKLHLSKKNFSIRELDFH